MHDKALGFAEEVDASFPPGLSLPAAFRQALAWLEANGCVRTYNRREGRYASLYPDPDEAAASCLAINPVDPGHAAAWIGQGVPGAERLALFIRTGGDGSYAALWLAPDGTPRFVHMGSGSGSTWAGVITDDPVEMLRFLAIGYSEACWPEQFEETPLQACTTSAFGDAAAFTPPRQFQEWLSATFGVTIPTRASEIISHAPDMDDDAGDDAFLTWLRAAQEDASGPAQAT